MAAVPASLGQHFLTKFESGNGDITLVLGDRDAQQSVAAHSFVLDRSPYFESALKPSFQEGQMSKVELPDVNPQLMKALIKGFYTDNLSHLKSDCGELSSEQLFELCELAERFLAPDSVTHCAYDAHARSVVDKGLSCQQYIDIFARLAGTRVPDTTLLAILPGFRAGVDPADWTVEAILPLVVEASLKKVDARVRDILNTELAKTVKLGENLAMTAVHAAKQGAVDAAVAIFNNLPNLAKAAPSPDVLDSERTTLHTEASALPSHVQQHLKLTFAMKALRPLSGLKAVMRQTGVHYTQCGVVPMTDVQNILELLQLPPDGGSGSTIESRLLQDMETASAELFSAAAGALGELRWHRGGGGEEQPRKRQRCT